MIGNLPEPLRRAIDALAALPSIGPRQATRLAFHLVSRGAGGIGNFVRSIDELKKMKICGQCFFIHENEGSLCSICGDPSRLPGVIMLLEKETDLISVENTRRFKGHYCILGAIPKVGILDEAQKLRLESLKQHIKNPAPAGLGGQAEEIILGFNPTSAGDFNANLLAKEFGALAKKITRLGRGLPTGGEIEFADDETLGSALDRRG